MLIENEKTDQPRVNALMALMCFHASRLEARVNKDGETVLYDEQDENLWNAELIAKGVYFMSRSAGGTTLSTYHLEAGIAYWSTQKADTPEKWENILQLYNRLLQLDYSPIAALNRTFALAKANGKAEAIAEAEKLQLTDNHFYFTLLGELYTGIDDQRAVRHFEKAAALAKTQGEKQLLEKKICKLG
jgi:predicted RNA polymerase sigma factor